MTDGHSEEFSDVFAVTQLGSGRAQAPIQRYECKLAPLIPFAYLFPKHQQGQVLGWVVAHTVNTVCGRNANNLNWPDRKSPER